MTEKQKDDLKKAFKVFLKSLIPPVVALISSVLTTLLTSGDVGTATIAGTTLGIASEIITKV